MSKETERRKIFQILTSLKDGEQATIDIGYLISAHKELMSITTKRSSKNRYAVTIRIREDGEDHVFIRKDVSLMTTFDCFCKAVINNDWAFSIMTFEEVTDKGKNSMKWM